MRRPIFTAVLALTAFFVNAQSAEDALKQLDSKKFDKAKEIVDKLTTDPNSKNADAWFVKSVVYTTLATDDKYKTATPDIYEQALEAYKKAYELEPGNKRILLDLYRTPFLAYEGIANRAAKAYQENNYQQAFDYYKKVIDAGSYLNSKNLSYNGFGIAKVDTGMVFMAGYTAMKLEKPDDAIIYFARLADAKIHSEADYVIPYQYLAYQYKTKKDETNLKKYAALGRELYPKDPYFTTIVLDWARENNNYPELFRAYDDLIALQPDTLNNYLSYASEMFNYLFKESSDKKPQDYDAITAKIETNLKKTLGANYEVLNSNLLLAQLYYNQGLDFATAADNIKSTKPDDVKKKNDLKAKAIAKYDLSIPYADKVAIEVSAKPTLKLSDKATMKNMYIMLGEMYTLKGDKVKSAEYDKKYEAVK